MSISTSSLLQHRARHDGGFTLIEILISLMFLSLGIMGIIAFFFLGAENSRQASRTTRATLMAKEIRTALIHALRYPLKPGEVTGVTVPIYRFELPSAAEWGGTEPEYMTIALDRINGLYFHIESDGALLAGGVGPSALKNFSDVTIPIKDRVLDLPFEAMGSRGNLGSMTAQYVWPMRDLFKEDQFATLGRTEYDDDDSHYYFFRILIRRGPTASTPTGGAKAGDLFAVTVYIFRQFDEANVTPTTWENYDPITGQALYTNSVGEPIDGVQPILAYHFYVSGA